jgi:hypothetical protein
LKSIEKQESTSQEENNKRFARFGQNLLHLLAQRGWNSIPKRELTLHLLHFAEQEGLLDLTAPRMQLSARLKVSPATLDGLLRDRTLSSRWAFRNLPTGQNATTRPAMTMRKEVF